MENECEALPGVAYPGVRDNRSTINTKTGYDDKYDDIPESLIFRTSKVNTVHRRLSAYKKETHFLRQM